MFVPAGFWSLSKYFTFNFTGSLCLMDGQVSLYIQCVLLPLFFSGLKFEEGLTTYKYYCSIQEQGVCVQCFKQGFSDPFVKMSNFKLVLAAVLLATFTQGVSGLTNIVMQFINFIFQVPMNNQVETNEINTVSGL